MKTNLKGVGTFATLVSILLIIFGCAVPRAWVTVAPEGEGEKVVKMIASSFKFVPSVIQAQKGDILIMEVENLSSLTHNLTIEDPEGRTMESVDLPGKETVAVRISLPERGIYGFLCDKPFHAALGMKGRIEVRGTE